MFALMRRSRTSIALALALTLPALALALPALAADPPLELAPLVPPKAPRLSKKKTDAPPGAAKSGVARRKSKTKRPGVAAQEPALELPPLVPLGPAAPAAVAAPSPASPSSTALPPPPLLKLSNQIGVLVQADAAQAALESGLQAIAALAPLSQRPRLVPRPAQRCGDDACAIELGKSLDELIVASLQAGQLRLRVLEIATRQRVGDPQQAGVKEAEAPAAAEAMACRVLVPAGCTGELKLTVAPGVRVEVDGTAVPPTGARLPVGLHALVTRSGSRSTARTIAIVHETPLSLLLPEDGESPRAAPLAVIAETPPADAPPARGRSWNKPAGIAVASAGAVAAGLGVYFGARSRSDLGTAEAAYRSNGSAYRTGDVATLSAGNSSARKANLLFAASAVLAGAGALLIFAF